ncbi:disulfide bond formation protein DsbA [Azospirillum sp. TSO35-2]|nr:disulfide bond formation protein DsbA [Azospirillum sp. TSO35-2]
MGLAGLLAVGVTAAFGTAMTAAPTTALAAATLPPVSELMADRVLGDPKAPVTILDYSSMTCPHCAHFHADVLPKIKETYIDTGKVKLIFRDFPFDQAALQASMLAHCAPTERYYPLTDVLFKSQSTWSRSSDPNKALAQYGKLAGMTQDTIDACFASKELADAILNSRLTGQNQYKIEATPTFILNDGKERVEGAQSFEEFAKVIDKLLK